MVSARTIYRDCALGRGAVVEYGGCVIEPEEWLNPLGMGGKNSCSCEPGGCKIINARTADRWHAPVSHAS